MSGHNKWSQIKHRKGAQDMKKSLAFSKILAAISIAARSNPNPDQNPQLRTLIERAKEQNVPKDNIERALQKANDKELREFTLEAYGPEKAGLIIEAITDNSNRTMQELKLILAEANAKVAEMGSVKWAFEPLPGGAGWKAKFPQDISGEAKTSLKELIARLEEHDDVQRVTTSGML